MSEAAIITMVVTLIGILKGKDFWDYLKHRRDEKKGSSTELLEHLKAELKEEKERTKLLEKRLSKHTLKSRGHEQNSRNSPR